MIKLNHELTTLEERKEYVNQLLEEKGIESFDFITSKLSSYELNAIGNYLLVPYEKENRLKHISDKEQNRKAHEQVQIDQQNGIKSYVKPKKKEMKYKDDKLDKLKSYEEFILPAEVQSFALKKLRGKIKKMSIKECEELGINKSLIITGINNDIKEINHSFSNYFEVKSKNEFIINRHNRKEAKYNIKTIERVLANHQMMRNLFTKHLDSDVFCTYQDVVAALKRCYELDLFTDRQEELILDLICYGYVNNKYYETLERALKKIKKMM